MHTMKFDKGGMTRIKAHVERDRNTLTESNIDWERTRYNVSLMPAMTNEQMQTYKNMAKRKDAVVLLDTILTLPEELRCSSMAKQTAFFRDALEAMKEHIGGVPAFAEIHYDETTPHLHYGSIPITQDGRLCAKEVCNRKMLKGLHPTVEKAVRAKGWDVHLHDNDEKLKQMAEDLGLVSEKTGELMTPDEIRETKKLLGVNQASMHQYRKKEYHNQLLQETSETIDKNLQVAKKDLQRSTRPCKRQKGETMAELKELRSEWVEVRKEDYDRLMAFQMQFNTIPDKKRAEKAKEEAERKEAEMAAEREQQRQKIQQHNQDMQYKRQNMDNLIEQRAEQKANQKVRDAFEGSTTDYTRRLEEYCASVKYQDGHSVLDGFKALEKELQRQVQHNRGWSR